MDFSNTVHPGRDWRHLPGWAEIGEPYCPKCRCVGLNDEQAMDKNLSALALARLAIFDLSHHSIGTPIEMYLRVWRLRRPAILISREGSLFVRYTETHYPTMRVDTPQHALEITKEILA